MAAQASLDPSFLWMVVAPSLRHPVGGGAAVAQVADAAEARGDKTRTVALSTDFFSRHSLSKIGEILEHAVPGSGPPPASSARAPPRTAGASFSIFGR